LIEDDLRGHPWIRATQDDREGAITRQAQGARSLTVPRSDSSKALVPVTETLQCC